MNGIHSWIEIDDDPLGRLIINGNDWIVGPSRAASCDQLANMFLYDFSCLREILPALDRNSCQGIVVDDEKGLVASITNMTKALRSLVPLLDTCIGVLAGCPGMG